jgi:hypothetical protein
VQARSLPAYVAHARTRHCAVKMLTGSECAALRNITGASLKRALQNLEAFSFVGITEAFNASVCLFHHQHGGPVRPGSQSRS